MEKERNGEGEGWGRRVCLMAKFDGLFEENTARHLHLGAPLAEAHATSGGDEVVPEDDVKLRWLCSRGCEV